jgi:hypothetical protein
MERKELQLPKSRMGNTSKMNLEEIRVMIYTAFIWLLIGTTCGLL